MADDLNNLPLEDDSDIDITEESKKKRAKKRRKPKKQKKPKKVKVKKKGSRPAFLKVLIRVFIITFVVLLQVGISYTLVTRFLMTDSGKEEVASITNETEKAKAVDAFEKEADETSMDDLSIPSSEIDYSKLQGLVTLSDLVVNTAYSNGKRYFVTSLVLAVDDKVIVEQATEREPMIRDRLISLLSQKTYAWLGNFTNRETLRKEILATVKSVLECKEGVHVYFTKYVLQ